MIKTDFEIANRRMYRLIAGICAGGILTAALVGGPAPALGFTLGAAFSALNFWFWHRLVARVGTAESGDGASRKPSTVLLGARYLLFGLAAYAILQYFEASLLAFLAGCFVAVAAVILEILIELVSAR